MADMLSDGNIRVSYVPAIANQAAPTTTELNAGTDLSCLIMGDGLDISGDEGVVSAPKLCETTVSEQPGRAKTTVKLTCVRKTILAEDIAWTTLQRGLQGYLVVRRGPTYATAWTIAQKVEVYPGTFGKRMPQKPEQNGVEKFDSQFYNSAPENLDAVVA
jgi:hypothetical protein